jgi:hypothetical protein
MPACGKKLHAQLDFILTIPRLARLARFAIDVLYKSALIEKRSCASGPKTPARIRPLRS